MRRSPRFTPTSPETVQLTAALLTELATHPDAIADGTRTLNLITGTPAPALANLDRLIQLARHSPTRQDAAHRLTKPAAGLLERLDDVVRAAAASLPDPPVHPDLTWQLLSVLHHRTVHLEGDDLSDRTAAVTALRHVMDPEPGAADRLFSRLDELAGQYASHAAVITADRLRRDCLNHPLRRAPQHRAAWRRLDQLQVLVTERTPAGLPTANGRHILPRTGAFTALTAALQGAAETGTTLLIHGEPDVGKSALALRAMQQLDPDRYRTWAANLRDIPDHPLQFSDWLGVELPALLASDRPAPARLLLLDGGETVLEGWADLIRHLAQTLPAHGIGLAVITRDDALEPLAQLLSTTGGPAPTHQVPPLDDVDLTDLVVAVPHLADLQQDERGTWLLARPGLVELLLQVPIDLLPARTLTETDLCTAVWRHLVRLDEGARAGRGSPDDRERALLQLARTAITGRQTGPPPDSDALAGLRSDGLLRSRSGAAAPGDEFRNDLTRDFSIARHLLTDAGLDAADPPPRWTLRAARIAAQTQLRATPTPATLEQLQQQYSRIADHGGTRWREVPLEALLALADHELLTALEPPLDADRRHSRRTLQRLALQRHRTGSAGDRRVFTALMRYLSASTPSHVPAGREERQEHQEVVLSWLRGLLEGPTHDHRRAWRDALLARQPAVWDEWAIEAVATLGADLDDQAIAYLDRVAQQQPYQLAAAVESPWAVQDLARRNWPLLQQLTELYYIDTDHDDDLSRLDLGIRGHQRPVGLPLAGWYYGPFWAMLTTRPVEAIASINRILNHATSRSEPARWGAPGRVPQPIDIPLPDGALTLLDRGGSWSWYRGGGRGPAPCVSALLAVERFADQVLQLQAPALPTLHRLLLTGCQNLAMAGLLTGLLVRNLEQADRLLDPWLQVPEIWEREFARAAEERLRPPSGPDPRTASFIDIAAALVVAAITGGDTARQEQLRTIGAALHATATADGGHHNSAGWAAVLDASNYQHTTHQGRPAIAFTLPAAVTEANADIQTYLQRQHELMRLRSTHLYRPDSALALEDLLADVDTARTLLDAPDRDRDIDEAVAGVAAAVVRAAALGTLPVPEAPLRWAEPSLLRLLIETDPDAAQTYWPTGADRTAARTAPLLLLLRDPFGNDAVAASLRYAATSSADEVRLAAAVGSHPVWTAPCRSPADPAGPCARHRPLLDAVLAATGHTTSPARLDTTPPLPPAHLVPLLLHTAAARSAACVTGQATAGFAHLLALHRQALTTHPEYGYRPTRQPFAELLVTEALHGALQPLLQHTAALRHHPRELTELLRDLGEVFTYDQQARQQLPKIWPPLLNHLLDQLPAAGKYPGPDFDDWAIAALLPVPRLRPADDQPDQTYQHALATGIPLAALAATVPRWLPHARRGPKAIDDLVLLLRCDDWPGQHPLGLSWLDLAVGDDFRTAARASRIVDWLRHIRPGLINQPDARTRWHRLVDGLAAAGDADAALLQQQDEA